MKIRHYGQFILELEIQIQKYDNLQNGLEYYL